MKRIRGFVTFFFPSPSRTVVYPSFLPSLLPRSLLPSFLPLVFSDSVFITPPLLYLSPVLSISLVYKTLPSSDLLVWYELLLYLNFRTVLVREKKNKKKTKKNKGNMKIVVFLIRKLKTNKIIF